MFNTSHPVAADLHNRGGDYANTVLSELRELAVQLLDSEAVMRERLNAHQRRRETREGAFSKPRDLELLLGQAGFCLQSCASIDVRVAAPIEKFIESISKQRYLAIAVVRSANAVENALR